MRRQARRPHPTISKKKKNPEKVILITRAPCSHMHPPYGCRGVQEAARPSSKLSRRERDNKGVFVEEEDVMGSVVGLVLGTRAATAAVVFLVMWRMLDFSLFSYHPVCMTLGYALMMSEAVRAAIFFRGTAGGPRSKNHETHGPQPPRPRLGDHRVYRHLQK